MTYLYYVIGRFPNEHFDSSQIDFYYPLSNSLLLKSISREFLDIPKDHFKILGVGLKNDYMLLPHTNNKAYYQFGNENDDFFSIAGDQSVDFLLFPTIEELFTELCKDIDQKREQNILVILQDHGYFNTFNTYPYLKFLHRLRRSSNNFFIFNDCCFSGSLVDLFNKNQHFFEINRNLSTSSSNFSKHFSNTILTLFAKLQIELYRIFPDNTFHYLSEFINFISVNPIADFEDAFNSSLDTIIETILKNYDSNAQNVDDRERYFSTLLDDEFFNTLNKNQSFNLSKYLTDNQFYDVTYFRAFLKVICATKISHLLFIKTYCIMSKLINYYHTGFDLFDQQNYQFFLSIEQQLFPEEFQSQSIKTLKMSSFEKIFFFFMHYSKYNIRPFQFLPNIEIVTSTDIDTLSLSYSSIRVNPITKVFPNTPHLAYFLRIAFFSYEKHPFDFDYFVQNTSYDNKSFLYFPRDKMYSDESKKLILRHHKLQHLEQGEFDFLFEPSKSLPHKIAVVRYLTYYVHKSLLEMEKLPRFDFSLVYSQHPSDLLINFISLSFFPQSDDYELKNPNFTDVLQLANLLFPYKERFKDRFEFILFCSIYLSSKIRFLLAKQLLLSLTNKNEIYLFSRKEIEYTQAFIVEKKLRITNDRTESRQKFIHDHGIKTIADINTCTNEFLNSLFSRDYITEFNHLNDHTSHSTENDNGNANSIHSTENNDENAIQSDENAIQSDENAKEALYDKLTKLYLSPEFQLQQMFLDLESSILNILPNDVFIMVSVYSFLTLKQHEKIPHSDIISECDLLFEKLNQVSKSCICTEIQTKFNELKYSFNNILGFLHQYISKRLDDSYKFLTSFYKSYYFASICKLSNIYTETPKEFSDFNKKVQDDLNDPEKPFAKYLTEIIQPFPLFCIPFLCFESKSYDDFFNEFSSMNVPNDIKYISDSLFISNSFYSREFRHHLANLSLYNSFKNNVLQKIQNLKTFIGFEKDISKLSSLAFFKDPFPVSNSLNFFPQKEDDSKTVIQYLSGTCQKQYLEQSINLFIEQFTSNIENFFNYDVRLIHTFTPSSSFHIFDIPQFDHSNAVYDLLRFNLNSITDCLNISDMVPSSRNDNDPNLLNLPFSVLVARFNNQVEIEPIVALIPEYDKILFNEDHYKNPTFKEFMALCSSVSIKLSPFDEFRQRIIKTEKLLPPDQATMNDNFHSPSNSPNSKSKFHNEIYIDDIQIDSSKSDEDGKYNEIIKEALFLDNYEHHEILQNYPISGNKDWTELFWPVFYFVFEKKLKDYNIEYTFNECSNPSYSYEFFDEKQVVAMHFFQIGILNDYNEKVAPAGFFLSSHRNENDKIKCAFVFAIMRAFAFFKGYCFLY